MNLKTQTNKTLFRWQNSRMMRRGWYCVLRLEIGSKTGRALFTRPYRKNYINRWKFNICFNVWVLVGIVFAVRALFARPYRKNYTNKYPNIETYVKFSSILNRLIQVNKKKKKKEKRKHSKCCPIGFKSTIEFFFFFTWKPMGSWFSVVPPLRANWPKLAFFIKGVKKEYGLKQFFTFFGVFKHDKLLQLLPKSFKQKCKWNLYLVSRARQRGNRGKNHQ